MHNNKQMRKKLSIYVLAMFGLLILLNSCKKEYESIESIDDAKILAYIKKNNLTMTKDPSGFYYQVVSSGTGIPLVNKDSVFYDLSVNSLDGIGYYRTPDFSNEGTYLGYLTPEAYRIALTGQNRGAKIRVILPSYLAFGRNGQGNIPPNEVILVELATQTELSQIEIDDNAITNYLTANSITGAVKSPSRVYYKIITAGTGTAIDLSSNVTVKYAGRLLDKTVFEQTVGDATMTYSALGGIIRGWDVLQGMKVGTKVRIFIPSDLAYATGGREGIPPNSVLDFDVEITNVTD
jgi:FKBP-type peptidyl-prolyl cis-trans isomerase FkpA